MRIFVSLPSFAMAMAVMLLLSVSVHPVLAQSEVKTEIDQINMLFAALERESGDYGASAHTDQSPIKDNKITSISIVEVGLKDSDTDDMLDITDGGFMSVRTLSPIVATEYASQAEAVASLAWRVPRLAPFIEDLTDEGYVFTSESHHRYDSTITAEGDVDRGRDRTKLAAAGIHISDIDIDRSTVTAREDVTYYVFTNPKTELQRVLTVSQLVGPDGVSLIGKPATTLSSAVDGKSTGKPKEDHPIWEWCKEYPWIVVAAIISVLVGMFFLAAQWWSKVAILIAIGQVLMYVGGLTLLFMWMTFISVLTAWLIQKYLGWLLDTAMAPENRNSILETEISTGNRNSMI